MSYEFQTKLHDVKKVYIGCKVRMLLMDVFLQLRNGQDHQVPGRHDLRLIQCRRLDGLLFNAHHNGQRVDTRVSLVAGRKVVEH